MVDLKEIVELQRNYQTLIENGELSKESLCSLCAPFRNKYHLTYSETIAIAQGVYTDSEIDKMLN